MKKVIVFGATGNSGQNIVNSLVRDGVEIVWDLGDQNRRTTRFSKGVWVGLG